MPKLLLADDSVTIQRVIELTFADENIQVVAVGDGQQAIARIDSERPDVVLADIGMPERDGYEVAAHIKGNPQTAHIPVLLLTGAFEPIDEARARAVGCDGVLVKPFEPQMVINRVKDLLAGRRPASLWATAGGPAGAAGMAGPAGAKGPERIDQPVPGGAAAPPRAPEADAGGSKESLDAYFDRLDAAFSNEAAPATPTLDVPAEPKIGEARADFGTWDIPSQSRQGQPSDAGPPPSEHAPPSAAPAEPVDRVEPARRVEPVTSPVTPAPTEIPAIAPEQNPAAQAIALADAFAALLAAEQQVGAPAAATPILPAQVDESTIEEIVRRVIARLSDDAVRSTVLDVAERLVREEIDRIKKQAKL